MEYSIICFNFLLFFYQQHKEGVVWSNTYFLNMMELVSQLLLCFIYSNYDVLQGPQNSLVYFTYNCCHFVYTKLNVHIPCVALSGTMYIIIPCGVMEWERHPFRWLNHTLTILWVTISFSFPLIPIPILSIPISDSHYQPHSKHPLKYVFI